MITAGQKWQCVWFHCSGDEIRRVEIAGETAAVQDTHTLTHTPPQGLHRGSLWLKGINKADGAVGEEKTWRVKYDNFRASELLESQHANNV